MCGIAGLALRHPVASARVRDGATDESPLAVEIAEQLGLIHQIKPLDESGLPSMLLCGTVKQHVTVALCGGGAEFFGGDSRYECFRRALLAQRVPRIAMQSAA